MGSQYTYQRVHVLHKSVRIYHPQSVLTEEAVNLCSLMPNQWLWGFSQTEMDTDNTKEVSSWKEQLQSWTMVTMNSLKRLQVYQK